MQYLLADHEPMGYKQGTVKKTSVLLVDDEPMIVRSVGRYLQSRNCHIAACGDGLTALRMAQDQHFDAVVADFELPHLNGLELLSKLSSTLPDCRMIMTSGSHNPGESSSTSIPPPITFLSKPFELESLLDIIKN